MSVPITVVSGLPRAGKTLYALSELVRPVIGTQLELADGTKVNRRVCVGHIPRLRLEHEPISCPYVDVEKVIEPHEGLERKPGEPPLEVEYDVRSWHLWCMPGDLIVIDEAHDHFPVMPSGRKIPAWIRLMAEASHYGVEFILITQHPTSLHTHIRKRTGGHFHIRRVLGGAQTVVFYADYLYNPDTALKGLTARPWRHNKEAFDWYRSAVAHIPSSRPIPTPFIVLGVGLLVLGSVFGWWKWKHKPSDTAQAQPMAQQAPQTPPGVHGQGQGGLEPLKASYIAPTGKPGFEGVLVPRLTMPDNIAGCWRQGDECACITQGEYPARVVRDRPALCLAVVAGDLSVTADRAAMRPERLEPVAVQHAQQPPDESAHAPSVKDLLPSV